MNGGCCADNLFSAVPANGVSKGPWVRGGRGALLQAADSRRHEKQVAPLLAWVLVFWGPGWDKQLEILGDVGGWRDAEGLPVHGRAVLPRPPPARVRACVCPCAAGFCGRCSLQRCFPSGSSSVARGEGRELPHLGPGTSVCAWSCLHPDGPRDRADMGGCRGAFSTSCRAGCRPVQLARWPMPGEVRKGCLSL